MDLEDSQAEMLKLLVAEQLRTADVEVKFSLSPQLTYAVVGCLQLALRHPGVTGGPTAEIVQQFVDGTIDHMRGLGLTVTAAAAELGNDPAHDVPC